MSVVFLVNASAAPTASVRNGNLYIDGSGSGRNFYVTADISSTDQDNWTIW